MQINELKNITNIFEGYSVSFWDNGRFEHFDYAGFGADNVHKKITISLTPTTNTNYSLLTAFRKLLESMSQHGLDMSIDWENEFLNLLHKDIFNK